MKDFFSGLWFFLVCSFSTIHGLPSHSLVYVHLGPKLPSYLSIAIEQARLFNPTCPIYVIAQQFALNSLQHEDVLQVPIESLTQSRYHKHFNTYSSHSGLWRYALERFFLIYDFMQQYGVQNVFHTENDVMLYFNLAEKLPTFKEYYPGMIATVFDCDERSVPALLYISDILAMKEFVKFLTLPKSLMNGATDMSLLSDFKDANYKVFCDHLPILIPQYAEDFALTNLSKRTAKSSDPYTTHLDKFQMIFDAAALGQFFGGIDPIITGPSGATSGFVGELSVFLPYRFDFYWERNSQDNFIPYISYKGHTYPIANLHIHCKNLGLFLSSNESMPPISTSPWSSLPLPLN